MSVNWRIITYRCTCPKHVTHEGRRTNVRTGWRRGCRSHPTPSVVEEDEFVFETPAVSVTAPSR